MSKILNDHLLKLFFIGIIFSAIVNNGKYLRSIIYLLLKFLLYIEFNCVASLLNDAVYSQCSPNPCINGNCIANSVGGFSCNCYSGYTGQRCDQYNSKITNFFRILIYLSFFLINEVYFFLVDPCSTKPCNSGTCASNDGRTFKCTCPPNFTGVRCERQLTPSDGDSCASSPCLGGGKCIPISYPNVNPPFACVCPPRKP